MKSPLRLSIRVAALAVCSVAFVTAARAQDASPESKKKADAVAKNADPLLTQVEEAIDISARRRLAADVHTPWQIMHGVLALRNDFLIKEKGEKVSAVKWLSKGASYRGTNWFQVTQYGGRAHPYTSPHIFEGHPNQFLAVLAMADLPMDHKLKAGSRTITIADIVKHAQMDVNANEEITWTLWALAHYLGPDARWQNKYGEGWSVERLARIQIEEPVYNAACGGTHGLFALSYARNVYQKTGKPLRGVWLEADQKIQRYVSAARSFQNSDGSFSSSYFQSRNSAYDFPTKCATSGHTLEFLMMALPEKRLQEKWVRSGVQAMAKGLIDHRKVAIDCGPLYHALSGLVIYRNRINPPEPKTETAKQDAPAVAQKPVVVAEPTSVVDAESSAEAEEAIQQAEVEAVAKEAEAEAKRGEAEAKRDAARKALKAAKEAEDEADEADEEAERARAAANDMKKDRKPAVTASRVRG